MENLVCNVVGGTSLAPWLTNGNFTLAFYFYTGVLHSRTL